jgi:hypothetical protein
MRPFNRRSELQQVGAGPAGTIRHRPETDEKLSYVSA